MKSIEAVNINATASKNLEAVSAEPSAIAAQPQGAGSQLLFPQFASPSLQLSSGLFNSALQTKPLPWSQVATTAVTDPAQFTSNLGTASDKILSALNSGPLGSFDAGAIDSKVNDLQTQAATDAANGNIAKAQQEMTQASILQQLVSALINQLGSQAKDSISNWRLS